MALVKPGPRAGSLVMPTRRELRVNCEIRRCTLPEPVVCKLKLVGFNCQGVVFDR